MLGPGFDSIHPRSEHPQCLCSTSPTAAVEAICLGLRFYYISLFVCWGGIYVYVTSTGVEVRGQPSGAGTNHVVPGYPSQSVTLSNKNHHLLSPIQFFESGSLTVPFFLLLKAATILAGVLQWAGWGCFTTCSFTRPLSVSSLWLTQMPYIALGNIQGRFPSILKVRSHSRMHIHAQHSNSKPLKLCSLTFPRWMKPWPHLLGIS